MLLVFGDRAVVVDGDVGGTVTAATTDANGKPFSYPAKLVAARAAVWGAEPESVRDDDRGQVVPIFKAPLKAWRPPRMERQPVN